MKSKITVLLLVTVSVMTVMGSSITRAATYKVPSDYKTIQDALYGKVTDGDTIMVEPGKYSGDGFRDLIFPFVVIHLTSEAGAAGTSINVEGDAETNHRFAAIGSDNGPSEGSTIEGFTFTGGYESWNAGAIIYDYGTSTTIRNCIFRDNVGGAYQGIYFEGTIANCTFLNNYMPTGEEVDGKGGAMQLLYSAGTVTGCTFEGNTSDMNGGALYSRESSTTISNCTFDGNSTSTGGALYTYGSGLQVTGCLFINNAVGGYGGAIAIDGYTSPTFIENTIVGNSAKYGSAVYVNTNLGIDARGASPMVSLDAMASTFTANLIAYNTGAAAFYIAENGGFTFGCNDIYGNSGGDWTGGIAGYLGLSGNISSDPMFCSQATGDFTVTANSPCAPDNNTCARQIGAYDVGCDAVSIVIEPTSVLFAINYNTGNPTDQTVDISNGGGYELNWAVDYSASWLTVAPVEGTNSGQLTLSVDVTGLTIGSYYDTLVVVDGNAINSPLNIPVQLDITYSEPPVFDPIVTEATVLTDGETPRVIAYQGESLTISYHATDADGNIPEIGYETIPTGATFVAGGDGTGVFTWDPVSATSGQYDCIITASDESQTVYSSVIVEINVAPSFSTACNVATIDEGTSWYCDFTVADPVNPEGYTTNVTAADLPANALLEFIGSMTWRLTFSPDYTQVGQNYTFDVVADDGFRQAVESVSLTVSNVVLQVVQVTPDPDLADMMLHDSIIIQFNEAIDVSTMGNGVVITSARGSAFQRSYNGDTYSVILKPSTYGMEQLDTINVVVSGGLRDLAGQWMSEPYTRTFFSGARVYPGDANNDGIVDERDLLPMGLYWSRTGPARLEEASLEFVGVMAHVRSGSSVWTPAPAVYADADGNGLIDAEDICGLGENWSATHLVERSQETGWALSEESVAGEVIQQMLAAAIECPETPGTKQLREMLQTALGEAAPALPTSLTLYGNYPNPFNPTTTISYYLPEAGQVTVEIFNLLGQRVATPVDQSLPAGYHAVEWNGRDQSGAMVASGIYLYRLSSGSEIKTGRMMLLK
ncbi:MAG TPA: T9SS type A sorting domain-containing protein [candidate division Zixibacteria bacterium]|nr:T9SS type A sorting domain-containing protein [candidate division Zixibacteria bacterium]